MDDWQENPNIVLTAPEEPWNQNCEPETYPAHFFRIFPSEEFNYTLRLDGTLSAGLNTGIYTGMYFEGEFCIGPQDVAGTIKWTFGACDQGVTKDGNFSSPK